MSSDIRASSALSSIAGSAGCSTSWAAAGGGGCTVVVSTFKSSAGVWGFFRGQPVSKVSSTGTAIQTIHLRSIECLLEKRDPLAGVYELSSTASVASIYQMGPQNNKQKGAAVSVRAGFSGSSSEPPAHRGGRRDQSAMSLAPSVVSWRGSLPSTLTTQICFDPERREV